MIENIHWLGHDSFRLDGSSTVYIDPWKLGAGAVPADLILITHDHYDHFSPDDIAGLSTPRTTLIGPASVTAKVDGVAAVTLCAGETATVGGVTVAAVAAYNIDKFRQPGEVFHPRTAGGLGYIVELDGRRIYHAGDTDAIPEMRDVRCDVALLPVSGTYVMTAEEAAEACRMISAAAVVPMHFGDIVGTAADAARFEGLCGTPVTVLPLEQG
jgi:L-ascorbate metabolism protein UlaG (beta-lactamase superfamily)